MRKSVAMITALVVVAGVGCSSDDDRGAVSNEASLSGTTEDEETPASVLDSEGRAGGSTALSVFELPAAVILGAIELPTAVGTNVATGLDASDGDLFLAQFHSNATVIDPIVPTLTPSVRQFYAMFGRAGTLCESWPLDDVYVNLGGALTPGSCEGFYRTLPDAAELPSGVRLVRHLPMSDGLATELMHRYEASSAAAHPEQSVVPIGFPTSRGADIVDQTTVTEEFLVRLRSAWSSRDPAEIGSLYTTEATRHDGFAGDRQGRGRIMDWYALLFDLHPDVGFATIEEYASGLGPGALYTLTMEVDGDSCTMQVAAVWDLNEEGLIETEYVYYDPETLLACNWAAT